MKIKLLAFLLPLLAVTASGQAPRPPAAPAAAPQGPVLAPALLIEEDAAFRRAWITAATKASIRYRETEQSTETKDSKISEFGAVYLYEPREFSAAMDLYQARKYEEARAAFAAVRERYKPLQAMENSHAALAAFYEMESMRRLGKLDDLNAALQTFIKDPLTRESHLRQIELYILWDALRTKSWDRLDILCRERDKTRLPGDQRAQVAYLHGLALEGLDRPQEALIAYSTAMTADAGASEDIARLATLRVLAIHKANPEVQNAIKVWGTGDEDKNSKGYSDLLEAAAVASLYELSLGAGTPLPAEYKTFLQYKASPEA